MAGKKKTISKSLLQKQELAEALLMKNGVDPERWLEEKYEQVIYENIDTIKKSIKVNEVNNSQVVEKKINENMGQ